MSDTEVIVVGAGLAGLSCAIHLQRAGRTVKVLEASNGVGGRVRSDILERFTLDRGFQVLLTAYPEAKSQLDYTALDLKSFSPGAFVQLGTKRSYLADPFREPGALLKTIKANVGSLVDKARIGLLQLQFQRKKHTPALAWTAPEQTTSEYLRQHGFSQKMIERFFRPFFGGIFLDPDLRTSSRMFEFVFSMLSDGDNTFPAHGMGAISDQLAARLAPGTIQLGTRAGAVGPSRVTLIDQGTLSAPTIVLATEGPQASKLLGVEKVGDPGSQPVSCMYFSASNAPFDKPSILLNGGGPADGPVNNFCIPTNVSKALGPPGKHLISASILGPHHATNDAALESNVREQLTRWFGESVATWEHLRTYHIHHAQPSQGIGQLEPAERSVSLGEGLFVCGDHRDQASINGALTSGRRCAEAILLNS